MMTLFKKEVSLFFSSWIGVISLAVFFVAMALIVFVFPETSVLDFGYATLDPFFNSAPYVLLFLIPAITMRSFAEEKSNQTLELLRTKPISLWKVILAKFASAKMVVFIALLATFCYVFVLARLAEPANNIDYGGIIGSYLGLWLLSQCFIAIGLFSSSLSNNQIVAFIVAVFLCFAMYFAFSSISNVPWLVGKSDYTIQQLGLESHYLSMSRGVVSMSDVVYFLSVIVLFWGFTYTYLKSKEV